MPLFNHFMLIMRLVPLAILFLSTESVYASLSHDLDQNRIVASSNIIRMNSSDWSPPLKRYQKEVIKLLLDNTRAKYGNYRLIDTNRALPPGRIRQNFGLGPDTHLGLLSINMLVGDGSNKNTAHQASTKIQVPILNGILGLRKLVIRSSDQEKFKQIRNKKDFISLTAGQGLNWPDVAVYKNADIDVITSLSYRGLSLMLQQKRFDYLPLSIIEADTAIRAAGTIKPKITNANGHYIMYNAPVYMYVSNDYPILVKRIQEAINDVIASGELKALFLTRFSHFINQISPDSAYVWVLDNPMGSAEENKVLTERNLKLYFNEKSTIIR